MSDAWRQQVVRDHFLFLVSDGRSGFEIEAHEKEAVEDFLSRDGW